MEETKTKQINVLNFDTINVGYLGDVSAVATKKNHHSLTTLNKIKAQVVKSMNMSFGRDANRILLDDYTHKLLVRGLSFTVVSCTFHRSRENIGGKRRSLM